MIIYGQKGEVEDTVMMNKMRKYMTIGDTCSRDRGYIKKKLANTWKYLRKVQKGLKVWREYHMEKLAENYAEERLTTKSIEVSKMQR